MILGVLVLSAARGAVAENGADPVMAGSAERIFERASAYREGTKKPQNVKKAIRLYEKAARAGHHAGALAIGAMFKKGQEVEEDFEKAQR